MCRDLERVLKRGLVHTYMPHVINHVMRYNGFHVPARLRVEAVLVGERSSGRPDSDLTHVLQLPCAAQKEVLDTDIKRVLPVIA